MFKRTALAFIPILSIILSVNSEVVTLQQGNSYDGCSDCWIGDISSISGNHNDDKLCMLNEC